MTDKPILFNAAMVNAILDGRKTQTRRLLKVPKWTNRSPKEFMRDDASGFWKTISTKSGTFKDLPIYQVGDRLYVREAWSTNQMLDNVAPRNISSGQSVLHLADYEGASLGKFRQGMHMPRWASRLTLVVTDVRVQRVAEISEDDAKAEGLTVWTDGAGWHWYSHDGTEDVCGDPREAFERLWNSINDARGHGWDANDWVVAVTFETHKCNIDQMEAAA